MCAVSVMLGMDWKMRKSAMRSTIISLLTKNVSITHKKSQIVSVI